MHPNKTAPHRILIALTGMIWLSACHHPTPKPSFYYWKSVFKLNQTEKDALVSHHVHKLYVKLFDVDLNRFNGKSEPIALLQCPDSSIRKYTIVPVTFITNLTMTRIDSNHIPELARNITNLATSWQKANRLPIPKEFQLDCDWTAKTRDKYFYLLHEIRRQLDSLGHKQTQLSATIRLYQCKYRDKTGVPPVAKGLLMCYNMGNLPNINTDNSILAPNDLSAYTTNLHSYPLPLDLAFPIFDWKVLFRDGSYTGLIKGLSNARLHQATAVQSFGGNRYKILRDTSIDGYDFLQDDILRDEESQLRDIQNCADRLSHRLKSPPANIILFHLDSANLVKYTHHELESIFNSCN